MKKYFDILNKVELFNSIDPSDLDSMLICLDAKIIEPLKNEIILASGNPVNHVGIVLEGQLHIIKEDIDGNRTIIATLLQGDFFGEALCCAGITESPISVISDTNSKVMLLEFRRILQTCSSSCLFHAKLIENMLKMLANRNILLQSRMDLLSKRTIRARLICYLESVALMQGKEFTIPFNREDLADFLCLDRSSLSRELGNLKNEGIIKYKKNKFTLLQ